MVYSDADVTYTLPESARFPSVPSGKSHSLLQGYTWIARAEILCSTHSVEIIMVVIVIVTVVTVIECFIDLFFYPM